MHLITSILNFQILYEFQIEKKCVWQCYKVHYIWKIILSDILKNKFKYIHQYA